MDYTKINDKELILNSHRFLAAGSSVEDVVSKAEIEEGYIASFKQQIANNPCATMWRVGKYNMHLRSLTR